MKSRKDDSANSPSAEMLTIDLRRRLNIADDSLETHEKEHVLTEPPQIMDQVQVSRTMYMY